MTRWQLVFEDFYRPTHESDATQNPSIWLARAAPKRWFASGTGFNVTNAPTRFGRVSYEVRLTDSRAEYHVTPPTSAPNSLEWKLRWPFGISDVACEGCVVAQVEAHGIAIVTSTDSGFLVASVTLPKRTFWV